MESLLRVRPQRHPSKVHDGSSYLGCWWAGKGPRRDCRCPRGFSHIAFLDDHAAQETDQPSVLGWPVLGPLKRFIEPQIRQSFNAALVRIGDAKTRLVWLEQLDRVGYECPCLIHQPPVPSAVGSGSVVFSQAAVQAQASIGSVSSSTPGAALIMTFNLLMVCMSSWCPPGRDVQVGSRSWIGIGASVIQQVRIASDVIVGAGAVVVSDLPVGVTVVGVPARILKKS